MKIHKGEFDMINAKRLLTVLVLVLMLSALVLPVSADVILEPLDDFYESHRKECEYRNERDYIVNTDVGHAYSYRDPETKKDAEGLPNGEVLRIAWVYTDKSGTEWGAYFREHNYYETHWIRMSDVTVIYDCFSFLEEHKDELVECEYGTYKAEATEEKPVIIWNYPGKKAEWSYTHDNVGEAIGMTYTDENGTLWGYVGYYLGSRNIWICITDPHGGGTESEEIDPPLKADPTPPENIPTVSVNGVDVELKAEPTPVDEIPEEGGTNVIKTVGALVGGVVLVTALAIGAIFGRKKITPDDKVNGKNEA